MKEYFNKNPFENRTIGFWLALGAAAIAIVSAVLFIVLDYGDKTFSMQAFILMLVGGIAFVAVMFTNFKTAVLIPALLYVAGFGFSLDYMLPPLSDVWNGVNFVGGNAFMGLAFCIIFFVCAVLGIVSNFMNMKKQN